MRVNNKFYVWNYPDSCCTTICRVKDNDNETITEATSKKAKNDCFVRNVGRKISLERVLQKMYPSKVKGHYDQDNRDKRIEVWNAYRNLTKLPRWK